jgi:Carboxypeptidase regulatory-like domain/TonB dependent receptor/TonB-dependent Receptor Plug Domain
VSTRNLRRLPCRSFLLFFTATLSLVCFQTPPVAFAQAELASLSGRVTDQTGAVIVGAEVEIRNVETNVSVTRTTNEDGLYTIPSLHPGHYVISARKPGFKTVTVTELVLNVQDNVIRNFTLQVGSASESITVTADSLNMNTQDATVSTVIDRNFAENLPLNGRSFNTLLQLTPGVVIAQIPASGGIGGSVGQFSIAGQRTDANNFTVDGVSANFGVSALAPISSGTGSVPAFSVLGGTSSLVSVDALQEFRVETSSFAPEFGRQPGGQVILTTRSGTNDFHGGIFNYFRNDALDANNWFNTAVNPAIRKAPERHNDFGGFVGGPILKNRTFFFISYEGARLRLPQANIFNVPSEFARQSASAAIAPYLNAYPEPDDRTIRPGVYRAQFTGSYGNSATLDAGSIRIDHTFNGRFSIFGRYNYAPSDLRVVLGEPSNPTTTTTNTQTLTAGVNMLLSARLTNTLRGNYSTQRTSGQSTLDSFGGAVPFDPVRLLSGLAAADNTGTLNLLDAGFLAITPGSRNRTRQLNFIDDVAVSVGTHQLKFGGDYRAIYLDTTPPLHAALYVASSVQSFVSTGTARLRASTFVPSQFLTQAFSVYGQDTWKITSRLALTYGLRWELAPAPSARGKTTLASWLNTDNPTLLALAPDATPLWSTTYGNFAPRVGAAYSLTKKGDFVVRAGWGLYYDLGVGQAANLANSFPNLVFGSFTSVSLPVSDLTPFLPVISRTPPFGFTTGIASNLKLPRTYGWNVALEKSVGGKQVISITYVGQAGRDVLRAEGLPKPNSSFSSAFLLTQNSARSNYNALQVQYRRPLSARVQALLNYTWSHSLDNASDDTVLAVPSTVISNAKDYASSSFDVRHTFSGAVTFDIPAAAKSGPLSLLTRDWSLDTVVVARSGFPFNGVITGIGPAAAGGAFSRPNLVPGQPLWIPNASAGGGKSLNPAAFTIPAVGQQGTEGRNDIPGFGLTQVDLSIRRKFPIRERVNLQLRADAFNVLNHPNFTNPAGFIQFGPSFLKSASMLNQGLGGLNPLFQEGGPRSLQLSLRLAF